MTSYKFKRFFFSVPTYLVFLCNFLFYIPNYCLINYDVYVQHLKISSYFKKIFLSIEINITKLYEELLFALFSYAYLLSFFFNVFLFDISCIHIGYKISYSICYALLAWIRIICACAECRKFIYEHVFP